MITSLDIIVEPDSVARVTKRAEETFCKLGLCGNPVLERPKRGRPKKA